MFIFYYFSLFFVFQVLGEEKGKRVIEMDWGQEVELDGCDWRGEEKKKKEEEKKKEDGESCFPVIDNGRCKGGICHFLEGICYTKCNTDGNIWKTTNAEHQFCGTGRFCDVEVCRNKLAIGTVTTLGAIACKNGIHLGTACAECSENSHCSSGKFCDWALGKCVNRLGGGVATTNGAASCQSDIVDIATSLFLP